MVDHLFQSEHSSYSQSVVKRMYTSSKGFVLLLFSILGICALSFAQVNEQDSLALVALYESADGDNWTNNENWLTGDVDTWYGVEVDGGRVIYLFLNDNGLEGTLPTELGLISFLQLLYLQGNGLNGTIPTSISNLSLLGVIDLADNELSGNLPVLLSSMPKLNELYLENNLITGSIPSQYAGFRELVVLNIANNQLSGSIPLAFQNNDELYSIQLSNNQLTGNIPSQLGEMGNIGKLNLSHNQLTGSIPISLFSNGRLRELELNNNELSGEIPEDVSAMSSLFALNLSTNLLSGNLPISLTSLENLAKSGHKFDYSNTELCEPQARSYQDWKVGRYIEGTGLECEEEYSLYSDSLALVALYESTDGDNWTNNTNWLTGDVDTWFGVTVENGRVTGIQLQDEVEEYTCCRGNNLIGVIPSAIGNLSELRFLRLAYNELSNPLPVELSMLAKLEELSLSDNQFEENIPSFFGTLENLQILHLSSNLFSGAIPKELGQLSSLKELHFTDNLLTGELPIELGDLGNLEEFFARGNLLSGELPKELGDMTGLQRLELNDNEFKGKLPIELGNMSSLREMRLDENDFVGVIPLSLTNLNSLGLEQWGWALDYSSTLLCEPDDPAWEQWKNGRIIVGTGSTCSATDFFSYSILGFDELPMIDRNNHIIRLNLPDVDLNDLVAIFEVSSEATVSIDGIAQSSGITANDFTNPVTYTISNEVGSEPQEWQIEITNESLVGGVVLSEYSALISFYNSTNGDNWDNNLNWLSNAPVQDWFGVEVENGRVVNIRLDRDNDFGCCSGNNLTGVLPSQIGNFIALKQLNLESNNIGGSLPNTFGNLLNLQVLHLARNQINGVIPEEMTELVNLEFLQLIENELTGSIPNGLLNMPSLEYLNLGHNDLSGTIPSDIDFNPVLDGLAIQSNNITGIIPSTIGNLTNLSTLYLHDNQLSGTIPIELGNLTRLSDLGLRNNQLSGSLPEELGNLTNIYEVFIDNNPLSGSIPLSFIQMRRLGGVDWAVFNYSNTDICEPQDQDYLDWKEGRNILGTGLICEENQYSLYTDSLALVALYESTNGEDWSNNENWLQVGQKVEDWYGVIVFDGRVSHISLNDNLLSGPIPSELGNLDHLIFLSLASNELSGSIPVELGNLKNIYTLLLSFNSLTGSIPESLGNLQNLTDLSLSFNQLSGSIPPNLGESPNLRSLELGQNQLRGSVPLELGELSSLINLQLSGNQLTGNIPMWITDLSNLQWLDLQSNSFNGQVPEELALLTQLRGFYISNNDNLCEPITLAYISWSTGLENYQNDNICQPSSNGVLESDSLALVALYESTNGDNWHNNDNWLEGPVLSWYGIEVNGDRVTKIGLQTRDESIGCCTGNNLIGSLPQELGQLTALTELNLSYNRLVGTIPIEYSQLLSLKHLLLEQNCITGTIEKNFAALPQLEYISLARNELTGEIPAELFQNEMLRVISLNVNDFTGEIPTELGNLVNLNSLNLAHNDLSGEIPKTIGQLENLQLLFLESNQLSGIIPAEIEGLTRLNQLDLSNNDLSGSIPTEIGNLVNLQSVKITDNEGMSGPIPVSIMDLQYLALSPCCGDIDISGTNMCEPVSMEWTEWKLGRRFFGNNTICSGVNLFGFSIIGFDDVAVINQLDQIIYLNLPDADLTALIASYEVSDGAIISIDGIVQVNNQTSNDFRDPVKVIIKSQDGLDTSEWEVIITNEEIINGVIRSDYEALEALYLATNGDSWWDNSLWLSLESVADWYGIEIQNERVVSISLRYNNLIGNIPEEIRNLKDIRFLNLYGNQLQGELPAFISELSHLRDLSLGENSLSGIVPNAYGDLRNLRFLYLDKNVLSGTIPLSFIGLEYLKSFSIGDNQLLCEPSTEEYKVWADDLNVYFNDNTCWKESDFLYFFIPGQIGETDIDYTNHVLSVNLTCDVSPVTVPVFALSDGAAAYIDDEVQTSGTNLIDYEMPVQYEVRPFFGEPQIWSLVVNVQSDLDELSFAYNVEDDTDCSSNDTGRIEILNPDLDSFQYSFLELLDNGEIKSIDCATVDALAQPEPGLYRIEFQDSYGDGWNGAAIIANTDGAETYHTLEEGSAGTSTITVPTGASTLSFTFVPGDWDSEVSFQIYSASGVELMDVGPNPEAGNLPILNCSSATSASNLSSGNYLIKVADLTTGCVEFEEVVIELICEPEYSLYTDSLALVALYQSSEGDNWTNSTNWLTGDIDTWYGVTVSNEGRVGKIELTANNLVGSLPIEFGDLTELETLNLFINSINGSIPMSFGNLKSLKFLNLSSNEVSGDLSWMPDLTSIEDIAASNNNLSGVIPANIVDLQKIKSLNLSNNNLEGAIPEEIGELMSLTSLNLSRNMFTGEIPESIGALILLENLNLSDNELSGQLPQSIFMLIKLKTLFLDGNQFTGGFTSSIGELINLEQLFISNNEFGELLPGSLGNLVKLRDFFFTNAGISGTIPPEVGNMTALEQFVGYFNSLSGELPKEFGNLQSLSDLVLSYNDLTGGIPVEIANLESLRAFDLSYNPMVGSIPLTIVNLEDLSIFYYQNTNLCEPDSEVFGEWKNQRLIGSSGLVCGEGDIESDSLALVALYHSTDGDNWTNNDNWLTGDVDTWYGVTLSSEFRVSDLYLADNNLTGTLPAEMGDLDQLRSINFGINNLTGDIPSEISSLSKLESLDMFANQLTGSIPPFLGQFTGLTTLHLSDNQFSETIPPELGNLVQLERLALVNNSLTGSIPEELGDLDQLKRLELHTNQLSGLIPGSLGDLHDLEILHLANNQLEGEIPDEIGSCLDLKTLNLRVNGLSGNIPASIGQLGSLELLYLDENDLTGSIPNEIGNLTNLTYLSIYENNLSGSIPLSIGQLTELESIIAHRNMLTGELPNSLANLTNLGIVVLFENKLSGTIPKEFLLSDALISLDLSVNLFDSLPDVSENGLSFPLSVAGNKLTFDDIEPNISLFVSQSGYSPQLRFGEDQMVKANNGIISLRQAPVGGTANSYQWYKDNELIEGATEEEYQIENPSIDSEGTYILKATNSLVPGLTLTSHPIELIYEPRTEKEILSYSIPGEFAPADIDESGRSITVYMPCDAPDISIPTFEVSGGAQAFLDDEAQVSGVTSVDLSEPVTYTVVAEDGSEALWTVTVANPNPIDIFSTINHLSSCNTSSGSITLDSIRLDSDQMVILPNSRYSLQWSNASTGHQIEVSSEGNYSVEVTDNETGCSYNRSFDVLTKDLEGALSLREKRDNTSCGVANGFISVDANIGSNQGLGFAWYKGTTASGAVIGLTKAIDNLEAGSYTLVVTDLDTDCTTSFTATIEDVQQALDISLKSTANKSCTAPAGTVELTTITVDGEERTSTLGYRVEWSETEDFEKVLAQTREVNGLASGTYYARLVGVATACTSPVRSVTLVDDQPSLTFNVSTTPNSRCDDTGNGSATLTSLPENHQIQWYRGETLLQGKMSSSINVLTSGSYKAVVTDKTSGCEATSTFEIETAIPAITLEVASSENTSCGEPIGEARVIAVLVGAQRTTNLEAFSFEWWLPYEDARLIQGRTSTLSNVLGDDYFVQVTLDSIGCQSARLEVTVEEDIQNFAVALTQSRPDLPGAQGTGQLQVEILEQPEDYTISWYEGDLPTGFVIGESTTLDNVNEGLYTILVTDQHTGCEVTATFEVGVDERLLQEISFDLPEIVNIVDLPLTLEATSDQGLPVSFTVVEGQGTISQNQLTAETKGTITIKAYNEGTTAVAYAELIRTVKVVSDFYLTGTVTGAADGSQVSGEVVVFTLDGEVFAQNSFTDGSYFIDGLPEGKYRLLIEVTGAFNALAFDTYYNRQLLWNRATILTINDDTEVNVELIPKTTSNMTGTGSITGRVVRTDGGSRIVVGRTLDGTPLADVDIYLYDRSTNDVVAQSKTDDDGVFLFDNIPSGQYYFRIDAVGFEIADLGADIDYDEEEGTLQISAALGQEGLTVEYAVVSGVDELLKDISIYPNPVQNILHVEDALSRIRSIQFLNLAGQLTRTFNATQDGQYDISGLTNGMYMMRIELEGKQLVHYKVLVKD